MSGLDGYTALADLPIRKHHPLGRVAVVYLDHRAFAFVGTVKDKKDMAGYDAEFVAAVESFHRLSSKELPLAKPLRIRIRRVAANQNIAELAKGSRIPNHPDAQLRLINGLYPKGEPSKGKLIKVVD